jgi:hypothetical protein
VAAHDPQRSAKVVLGESLTDTKGRNWRAIERTGDPDWRKVMEGKPAQPLANLSEPDGWDRNA